MSLIPLFPLGSVLFPGAALPLHIFEPRYKLMIAACIERQQPFGVVLIREGSEVGGGAVPHDVGTTARISRIQHLPDGRLNITAVGLQRFRIASLDRSEPYLAGELTFLQRDRAEQASSELAQRVAELFTSHYRLRLALENQWTRRVGLPTRPEVLADFIGARLEIPESAKQRLLELDSVSDCLAAEVDLLEEATAALTSQVHGAHQIRYAGFGMMN